MKGVVGADELTTWEPPPDGLEGQPQTSLSPTRLSIS